MNYMFTPGCALLMYKPQLADKTEAYLKNCGYDIERSLICCRHQQNRPEGTTAVVVCSGCARRFKKEHQGLTPVSLWELMAEDESLQLPDYGGLEMSLHDACPTKADKAVTSAVRRLLERMNIKLVEAEHNRERAVCCGDSFYGKLPEAQVLETAVCKEHQLRCISAKGKSNIFSYLTSQETGKVMVIADGAAFGAEMEKVMKLLEIRDDVVLYLPESFEWLVLKSGIIHDSEIPMILGAPYDYLECSEYLSWERYFTELLVKKTEGTYLQYGKRVLNAVYMQTSIADKILKCIKNINLSWKDCGGKG